MLWPLLVPIQRRPLVICHHDAVVAGDASGDASISAGAWPLLPYATGAGLLTLRSVA